ncbi:hypothetical protein BDV40DRAFT_119012 [Aspergillus tamarii]|uniref:Uncharacterized protein n=1 Tax=Aspergillus tamarii TaxID=41984 RepID=A0A5N6UAA5_ASPTM|nr:hypothetical protein BDV40DRAFT_119012 [Aspergillus tamarii]
MIARPMQRSSLGLLPLLNVHLALLKPGRVIAFAVGAFRHKPGGVAVRTSSGLVLARTRATNSVVGTDVSYMTVSLAVVTSYYARRPVVQSILGGPEVPDSARLDGFVCMVRRREFNDNRECLLARRRTDEPADMCNLAGITPRVAVVGHELLGDPLTVRLVFQWAQGLARHVRGDHPPCWKDGPRRITESADPIVPVGARDFRLLGAAEKEPQVT